MDSDKHANSWSRNLLIGAILWLAVATVLVLQMWPSLPHSTFQWVALVAFGPPLYVLAEGLFAWLFSRKHGYAISRMEFSFRRIIVAIPLALFAVVVSWWLSWMLTA